MIPALLTAGLALLPKLPELWGTVASLFGKEVPQTVEKAGELGSAVLNALGSGNVSEETRIKLQELMMANEKSIRDALLREKELEITESSHERDTQVQLWGQEAASSNQYVQETRPKILRQFFYLVAAFTILALISSGILESLGKLTNNSGFINLLEWIGSWLYGTFTTAYIGYSGLRTVDKWSPSLKDKYTILNKVL